MSAEHTWHIARSSSLEKMKADSDRKVDGENGETQEAESPKCSWASLKIRVSGECKCKRHLGQNFKCDFAEIKANFLVQHLYLHYLDVVWDRRIWKVFMTPQRHFNIYSFGCFSFALRGWGQNSSCLNFAHWKSKIISFAKDKENNFEQVLAKFIPKVLNSSLWWDLM